MTNSKFYVKKRKCNFFSLSERELNSLSHNILNDKNFTVPR